MGRVCRSRGNRSGRNRRCALHLNGLRCVRARYRSGSRLRVHCHHSGSRRALCWRRNGNDSFTGRHRNRRAGGRHRGLSHNGTCRWSCRNRWRRRRRRHDGRCGPWLRHNPARRGALRLSRRRGCRPLDGALNSRRRGSMCRSRRSRSHYGRCGPGCSHRYGGNRSGRNGSSGTSGGRHCSCYRSSRHGARRRRRRLFSSLLERSQHISGLGDMGQINLGSRRRIAATTGACAGPDSLEVSAHTFGLVKLQRTGVRFLLCNADVVENIQNCLALNFQFAR
jgi:hypothetical protein